MRFLSPYKIGDFLLFGPLHEVTTEEIRLLDASNKKYKIDTSQTRPIDRDTLRYLTNQTAFTALLIGYDVTPIDFIHSIIKTRKGNSIQLDFLFNELQIRGIISTQPTTEPLSIIFVET